MWYPAKPSRGGPPFGRLHKLLAGDPAWQQEPKFDGWRVIATVEAGKAKLVTRTGVTVQVYSADLRTALEALGTCELDGELMRRSDLWVFDAPSIAGTLATRRAALEAIDFRPPVRLVPILDGIDGYAAALAMGAEGVVMKDRRQAYPRARRPGATIDHWFKIKP